MGGISDLPSLGAMDVGRGYQPGTPSSQGASPPWLTGGGGERYRETKPLPPTSAPLQGGAGGGGYGIDSSVPSSFGLRDPSHRPSHASSSSSAAAAAEAAISGVAMDSRRGNVPSWDSGSAGRCGVSSEAGGGLASRGLGGGRWSGAGDRSGGPGAYMDLDDDRKLYPDDQLQLNSPVRDRQHRQAPSQPQGRQRDQHFVQPAQTISAAGGGAPPRWFIAS